MRPTKKDLALLKRYDTGSWTMTAQHKAGLVRLSTMGLIERQTANASEYLLALGYHSSVRLTDTGKAALAALEIAQ